LRYGINELHVGIQMAVCKYIGQGIERIQVTTFLHHFFTVPLLSWFLTRLIRRVPQQAKLSSIVMQKVSCTKKMGFLVYVHV